MIKKIKHAIIIDTNEAVQFISVTGGWTTITQADGTTIKLRNSKVRLLTPEEEALMTGAPADAPAPDRSQLVNPDYSHYVKHDVKCPSGRPALDIDDEAAALLRGQDISDCYFIVAKHMAKAEKRDVDTVEAELKTKYEHLNVGMQRMNLGNRLRKLMGTYGNINAHKTPRPPKVAKPPKVKAVKTTKGHHPRADDRAA